MVRMTCAAAVALAAGMASAQNSITTTFAGGNGQDGAMFDMTNVGTLPVQITGFDYRLFSGGGAGIFNTIEVYYVTGGGSYAPHTTNAGAWTLMGTDTVETATAPAPIHVNIGGLTINPGETYGLYFTEIGVAATSVAYTNGNGSNQQYNNGEVQLDLGVGKSYPFGSTFTPRVWNGTIYYNVIPAPGAAALLGIGGLVAIRRRR